MSIKQKIIIYIVLVAIFIGGIIYSIILPTISDIKKINDGVLAERVDLEKKYLKGQLLNKTIENFEIIKPEEKKLDKIYIGADEELVFITALENIATNNNVIQDIGLSDTTSGATAIAEPLSLTITTSGTFIDVLQYLKDIERLNYYFNIENISTTSGSNKLLETSGITINIKGEIFKSITTTND